MAHRRRRRSAAYIALFVMIGVLVRRAAVWALAVVFLGERLLGGALSGIAQLSPLWQAQQVYAGLRRGRRGGHRLLRDGMPQRRRRGRAAGDHRRRVPGGRHLAGPAPAPRRRRRVTGHP